MIAAFTAPHRHLDYLRDLLAVLTRRNLKVRYRGSILGIYWSLLNPLTMTAVYTAVFSFAFKRYYNDSFVDYFLAVFIGLVVINFFSAATAQALPSVVANSALVNKIRLPMEIFPISVVAAHTFQLLVGSIPVLAVVGLIFSKHPLNLFWLPVPIVALVALTLGVSLFVSAVHVFFRDIPYFFELVTFLLWITTPVFYPLAIVHERIQALLVINPLFLVVQSLREILLSPSGPALNNLLLEMVDGALAAAVGWWAFRAMRRHFMDMI